MSILLDRLFAAVAFGHLLVDVLNSQIGVLLAFLSIPLALTNTAIGVVSTVYMITQSLFQPVAGYLADRLGSRWLAAGGIFWMGMMFTLAVTVQGKLALVFLVLASLGSGAFHPAGSKEAILYGRNHLAGREGAAASYFFTFGQIGFFLGPLLGGPLLDLWGPVGLLALVFFCLPVGGFAGASLGGAGQIVEQIGQLHSAAISADPAPRLQVAALLPLLLGAVVQSWISLNISTFVPKYLSDMGKTAATYGLVISFFMAGSAIGNLLGGYLADRFSRRIVVLVSFFVVSMPVYLIGRTGYTLWIYPLICLVGICSGAAYMTIYVDAQGLIPGGMGMANGLIMAFMFSSGTIGVLISGYIAEAYGFLPVFYSTAALSLLGAFFALWIKPKALPFPASPGQAAI